MNRNILGIHLAAFLFGMTGILGTLVVADSNTITFGRALFAVLTLSPLLWFGSNREAPVAARCTSNDHALMGLWWRYIVSGGLLAVHWVTFFMSVKTAGVAIATLGFSSFAAFITLIEWLIAPQSVHRSDAWRTLMVTIGLALITPALDFANQDTFGFLMGLLSGLSFAAMAVFNSRAMVGINPIRVARNQNLVVCILLGFWAAPAMTHLSFQSWWWLAVLGVFCTGLSHSLFVSSLKAMRVNTAGLVIALEPVYAITVAWLLFHEVPTLRTIIGGLIVIGAIIGVSYSKTSQPTSQSTER